ncbi:unnamed protein product [Camellia sinensis]
MSGVTCCLRFPGQLNFDLRKLAVHFIPLHHRTRLVVQSILGRELGRGAFGVTYLCSDREPRHPLSQRSAHKALLHLTSSPCAAVVPSSTEMVNMEAHGSSFFSIFFFFFILFLCLPMCVSHPFVGISHRHLFLRLPPFFYFFISTTSLFLFFKPIFLTTHTQLFLFIYLFLVLLQPRHQLLSPSFHFFFFFFYSPTV